MTYFIPDDASSVELAAPRVRVLTDPRQLDRMTLADLRHAFRAAEQQRGRTPDPRRRAILSDWMDRLQQAIAQQTATSSTRRPRREGRRVYDDPLDLRIAQAREALDPSRGQETARERAKEIKRQLGQRP